MRFALPGTVLRGVLPVPRFLFARVGETGKVIFGCPHRAKCGQSTDQAQAKATKKAKDSLRCPVAPKKRPVAPNGLISLQAGTNKQGRGTAYDTNSNL